VRIQPKQPTGKGPAEWFTATSSSTPSPRARNSPASGSAPSGSPPRPRTAWHAHAVGQTLYLTEGKGLVQSRRGPVEKLRAGDVVVTPPDEEHWHGAAPDHFMTHLSITKAPADQRPVADWGEHVTDTEYHRR
jgi:quercetin dioxygenase-like cupin family protein